MKKQNSDSNRYIKEKKNIKNLLIIVLIILAIIFIGVFPMIAIFFDGVLGSGEIIVSVNLIENVKALSNPRVRFMYGVLFLLMSFLILVMFIDVKSKGKIKNKGEHGTARVLGKQEFIQTVTTCNKNSKEKQTGLIICNEFKVTGKTKEGYLKEKPDKDETYYVESEDKHDLTIGTTRSGKTRRQVLPSIYALSKTKESMVINDPKGELFSNASSYLKDKGYDVIKLDFRNAEDGNRYNFLSIINHYIKVGEISKAEELSKDMAHAITYREKSTSSDPVWQRGEKATIAALILLVAMYAKEDEVHMYSVYNNLVELGRTKVSEEGFEYCELNEMISKLPPGHPVKRALGTAAVSPTNMRTSFYASALANLEIFSDPSIAYLTAKTDHELKNIGRKATAVFLIVPDEKETRHVMSSLYVDQLYVELVDLANENNGRLPNRVHFVLDEFGNMPPINGFASKMTVAAGRGILFHLFIQDLGQLNEKYGKVESIIKGNCHNWIYLLTTDIKTAEEISKKAGSMTIYTHSKSESEKSSSYSTNLTKRPLLTPDEILRFKIGEVLLLRSREQPFIGDLMDFSNYSFAKEFGKPLEMIKFMNKDVPIYIAGDEIFKSDKQEEQEEIFYETNDNYEIDDTEEEERWEDAIM